MILITDMVLSTVTLPQDNEELLLGSASGGVTRIKVSWGFPVEAGSMMGMWWMWIKRLGFLGT